MPGEIAITLQDVSKMYRLFASKGHRLREALHPFRRTYHRQFWALRNITLQIARGHTVGILGLNGSGKSTLLQIIASVLQPTSGTVEVVGRVAALLELGAGFNPELTGRENVFLNGTIMGLSRQEILPRLEAVQAFADIGEFFDQPVRTYSSGMFMRLAFATAIHVDPDILIIDEALSVGDAKFQEKCFRKFREFQEAGKSILFVTHDRSAIPRYCNMGILLHQGELVEVGEPGHVAELYGEILAFGRLRRAGAPSPGREDDGLRPPDPGAHRTKGQAPDPEGVRRPAFVRSFLDGAPPEDHCQQNPTYNKYEHRFGNGHAAIVDYLIAYGDMPNPTSVYAGGTVDIYTKVLFRQEVASPIAGIIIKNKEGVIGYGVNTEWMKERVGPGRAGKVHCYRFSVQLNLCPGDWFIDMAIAESSTDMCDNRGALAHVYLMEQERQFVGLARLDAQFEELGGIP